MIHSKDIQTFFLTAKRAKMRLALPVDQEPKNNLSLEWGQRSRLVICGTLSRIHDRRVWSKEHFIKMLALSTWIGCYLKALDVPGKF